MPESHLRLTWNFIVLCLLLYTATFVPFRTAFIDEDDPESFLYKFEIVIDSMYIFDFCLNFLMAYEDRDKKIEKRIRFIALNYIKGWFLLDFVSCIPF